MQTYPPAEIQINSLQHKTEVHIISRNKTR